MCNSEGRKIFAQLLPDEYNTLLETVHEGELLRSRVKDAESVLLSFTGCTPADGRGSTASYVSATVLRSGEVPPDRNKAPLAGPEAVHKPTEVPAPETKASAPSVSSGQPVSPPRRELPVVLPPVLIKFLEERDSSGKCRQLIECFAERLSSLSGRRITMSLHKPYICLWDFDAWKTFAFGEVINGKLHLSIEKSLVTDSRPDDTWTPPSGLCKTPLVRLKVDAVSDMLLSQLKNALVCSG